MGKGTPRLEQQVKGIIEFAKVIEMYEDKIELNQDKIDRLKKYVLEHGWVQSQLEYKENQSFRNFHEQIKRILLDDQMERE